jgi:hypothetical protein
MKVRARAEDPGRAGGDQRDPRPGPGEQAGEAVGGIGGALAGAALGSAAGPVGTILGGLAGAVGGWWAGERAGRAAEDMERHEHYYRGHFDELAHPELDYEEAKVGYGLGHVAGRNPEYAGRAFEEIEDELRRGWNYAGRDFDTLRPYVRVGYERTIVEHSRHERSTRSR